MIFCLFFDTEGRSQIDLCCSGLRFHVGMAPEYDGATLQADYLQSLLELAFCNIRGVRIEFGFSSGLDRFLTYEKYLNVENLACRMDSRRICD